MLIQTITLGPAVKYQGSLLDEDDNMVGVYEFTKESRRKKIDCRDLNGMLQFSNMLVEDALPAFLNGFNYFEKKIEVTLSLSLKQINLMRLLAELEQDEVPPQAAKILYERSDAILQHMHRSDSRVRFGDDTARMFLSHQFIEEVKEGMMGEMLELAKVV
jgi:hypothetical protein